MLDTELCLSAYPNCLPLLLNSCCADQTGICVDMNNIELYTSTKKDSVKGCLRNRKTGSIFELKGDINEIPGYEYFKIPNKKCQGLGCKNKGLDCLTKPVKTCDNILKSPCCATEPICGYGGKTNKLLSSNATYSNINCDSSCPEGFNCRYIGEKQQCIASNCNLIECPKGTECLPLEGLNIVSCFKTIAPEFNQDLKCDDIKCPGQFYCGKGVFTNSDCIPRDIDLVAGVFDCSICPKNWKCDKFGGGGLCIEWKPSSPGDGVPCLGGVCLFNQFCNETSKQCEFSKCDDTICNKPMSCVQYQASHPRICASTNIIPFTSLPDS